MPVCVRGRWTASEDAQLLRLVNKYGARDWTRIARCMKNRSNKSCRSRYHQHLAPSINSDPITQEEGNLIIKLVEEIGKQWAEIARRLPRRTDSTVKNWWYTAKKRDCRIEQRLERICSTKKVIENVREEGAKGTSKSQPQSTSPISRVNTGPVCSVRLQMQDGSSNQHPQHLERHLRLGYQQQYQYLQQNYLQHYLQNANYPQGNALPGTQVGGDPTRFMSVSVSLQDYSPPPSPWIPAQSTAPEAHYPSATTYESRFIPTSDSPTTSYSPSNGPNSDFNPGNLDMSPNKQPPNSCIPATSSWSVPSTRSLHPQELARRMQIYREGIEKLSDRHYEQCRRFQMSGTSLVSKKWTC